MEGLFPPGPDEPTKSVYLVSHLDWHTGIVVRRSDIPAGVWTQNHDFQSFEYLEVGWGDMDYYQALEPTAWMAIKAALWPTPSVLHIVGFNGPVERYFPESAVVEIELSNEGFKRLCTFIQETYASGERGAAIDLGTGLLENSRFYAARGKFHLLRTCNVWTADALRSAGCPINPVYALRAKSVFSQASRFGKVIRSY